MNRFLVFVALLALGQQARPLPDIITDLDKLTGELRQHVTPPSTIRVPPGGDVQAALDAVTAKGSVLLTADAVYTGNFVIRRSDFTLTTEGVGLARLRSGNGATILAVLPGVQDVTIRQIAVGPFAGNDAVTVGANDATQTTREQQPRRILLDELVVTADPSGAKRGVALHCADCTVMHSKITGFQRVGQDTQAIYGVNGEGPFLILDNDLEAAGENIMFGGDTARIPDVVPSDITIDGNRLTKNIAWKGTSVTAKNLIELKAGRRVKIINNDLRYSWIGQGSYALMLTPSNIGGGNPLLSVETVLIDSNVLRDVGAGINILGNGQNSVTAQTKNITITRNWITTDSCTYGGQGWPLFLSREPANVVVEQNSIEIKCGNQIVFQEGPPVLGFRFAGNLVPRSGVYGFSGTAGGTTQHRGLRWQEYYPGGAISGNALGSFPTKANIPDNLHLTTAEMAPLVVDGYGTGAVSGYGRPRP